jgi:hypothetical protein
MLAKAAIPSLFPMSFGAIVMQIQSPKFADTNEDNTPAPPSTITERIPKVVFSCSRTWHRSSELSELRRQGRICTEGSSFEEYESAASWLQQTIRFRALIVPSSLRRCLKLVSKTTGLGWSSPHNLFDNLGLSVENVCPPTMMASWIDRNPWVISSDASPLRRKLLEGRVVPSLIRAIFPSRLCAKVRVTKGCFRSCVSWIVFQLPIASNMILICCRTPSSNSEAWHTCGTTQVKTSSKKLDFQHVREYCICNYRRGMFCSEDDASNSPCVLNHQCVLLSKYSVKTVAGCKLDDGWRSETIADHHVHTHTH